jgi:flagellar FliJ protein
MAGSGKAGGFRLEHVLEHRKRRTEEAEGELARRAREHLDALETLEALQQERDALHAAAPGTGPLDVTTLVSAELRDLRLRAIAYQQEQAVMEAEIREAAARDQLLERRVEQKALEKLRERHMEEQRRRLLTAQERLLDELATAKHGAQRAATTPGGAK